jgi:C-terminal processing protease CtpA/Prc
MSRFKKILLGILLVVVVLFGIVFSILMFLVTPQKVVHSGELKQLTREQKLEDFNYLYSTLKDSFPFFEVEKDKTGFDWLGNKAKFEDQIKATKNNEEFYYTLKTIVTMVQNAHTTVLAPSNYENMVTTYSSINNKAWGDILTQSGVKEKYSDWSKIVNENKVVLPIKIKYVDGLYVVIEDLKNIKKGATLEAIDDMPIDAYFKANLDKYYLNYDDKRDKLYVKSNMITVGTGRDYKVTAESKGNKGITEYLTPIKYEQNTGASASSSSSDEKILVENKVAYVKVKSMSNKTLEADGKKLIEFYKSIKDYPYLIIDIRGNGGGTDNYWQKNIVEPLISQTKSAEFAMAYKGEYIKPFLIGRGITTKPISNLPQKFSSKYVLEMERFTATSRTVKPQNSVGFSGNIYLLVDDYVYSSSETFAAFSKGTGFSKLVGTTTGGDGIGIDPCVMALPNSGLVVRFSLDMGISGDGMVNEKAHTKPDIYAEVTYEDFINDKDTILNKVLELCTK